MEKPREQNQESLSTWAVVLVWIMKIGSARLREITHDVHSVVSVDETFLTLMGGKKIMYCVKI